MGELNWSWSVFCGFFTIGTFALVPCSSLVAMHHGAKYRYFTVISLAWLSFVIGTTFQVIGLLLVSIPLILMGDFICLVIGPFFVLLLTMYLPGMLLTR
jgi:hypothetical protein